MNITGFTKHKVRRVMAPADAGVMRRHLILA